MHCFIFTVGAVNCKSSYVEDAVAIKVFRDWLRHCKDKPKWVTSATATTLLSYQNYNNPTRKTSFPKISLFLCLCLPLCTSRRVNCVSYVSFSPFLFTPFCFRYKLWFLAKTTICIWVVIVTNNFNEVNLRIKKQNYWLTIWGERKVMIRYRLLWHLSDVLLCPNSRPVGRQSDVRRLLYGRSSDDPSNIPRTSNQDIQSSTEEIRRMSWRRHSAMWDGAVLISYIRKRLDRPFLSCFKIRSITY